MYRSFDITASPIANLPKSIVAKVLPDVTVVKIQAVPPARLHRLFEITLSDSRTMLLAMSPPEMLRLLRSEQSLIRSEAVLVRWLTDAVASKQSSVRSRKQTPSIEASKGPVRAARSTGDGNEGEAPVSGVTPSVADNTAATPGDRSLHNLLPSLVAQSATRAAGALYEPPFALYDLQQGVPLVSLDKPLTRRQQDDIDYQAGRLAQRLAEFTPDSNRFGSAMHVLSPDTNVPLIPSFATAPGTTAAGSWSLAFHTMFESVLRDAEDMAVTLSYANIRRHFRRLEPVLDEVVVPRLVVVNSTNRSNVLVSLSDQKDMIAEARTLEAECSIDGRQECNSGSGTTEEAKTKDPDASKITPIDKVPTENSTTQVTIIPEADTRIEKDQEITLTGLRDWSHAIFGDPLFSRAFTHDPSQAFLHGFRNQGAKDSPPASEPIKVEDVSEPSEHAALRLMLYQCYHDIVDIVTTFYRPTRDSRTQELTARKHLTVVLAKMEKAEIPSSMRRHRRLSDELSPAKRVRIDAGNVGSATAEAPTRAVLPRSFTSP